MEGSFKTQVWLLLTVCSHCLSPCVAKKHLTELNIGEVFSRSTSRKPRPTTAIQYVHKGSCQFKQIARESWNYLFIFRANKLVRYENVNRTRSRREVCIKKYVLEIIGSAVGAVYNILLPCSSNYVGQTGRRHKDYLRKHAQTLDTRWGSNVAIDAALCSCISSFEQ